MECLSENRVVDFLTNGLSPEQMSEIGRHADGCPHCRGLLVEAMRVMSVRTGETVGEEPKDQTEQLLLNLPRRYRVTGVQGRGGQARVLVAFDETIGREVALKELLPESDLPWRPEQSPLGKTLYSTARFYREALITGQLSHPNIVPVYEMGDARAAGCTTRCGWCAAAPWRRCSARRGALPIA